MAQLTDEDLANIAHDFYLSKLNIGDISKKYHISRYLITKALENAEKRKIVKITISKGLQRREDLERYFQEKFNLKDAIVLNNLETTNQDNEAIVSYAAKQIQTYIQSSKVIGTTWGTLLRDIIDNFNEVKQPDLTFVQLLGQPINSDQRKNSLVQLAAKKYGADSFSLPAPLYVLNSHLLDEIKKEPFYQTLDNYYKNLDLIFSSIGTFDSFITSNYMRENYKQSLFKNVNTKEIAGMIYGHPYDINGNFFDDLNKNICGISLEEIQNVPVRFTIVKNRFKTKALLGALRSGIITHLIINEGIAKRIISEINQEF
ncbi:sugar-binding transcriptional regulator [Lactobacillus agrestimuris]|uniref:sugar-binding transcriptional regulator n=1 Tax=Lactobacillus agrestimuris TaxID=2941328 RepID=UPI00199594BB|nr:sugar-binding domain-containing protein [Lactobacillus agrestimuris]MBD5431013.1 DNA-binding transcriptional regulator [Lactobacillus sp.]